MRETVYATICHALLHVGTDKKHSPIDAVLGYYSCYSVNTQCINGQLFESCWFIAGVTVCATHLRIVFHDTTDLLHHVNAPLLMKGIYKLG